MQKIFLVILSFIPLCNTCCSISVAAEDKEDTSSMNIEELKNRIFASLRRMKRQNERSLLWIMYFEAKEKRVARYKELCEKLEKSVDKHFEYAIGDIREKALFALARLKQLKKDKEYDETYYWYFNKLAIKLLAVAPILCLSSAYLGGMLGLNSNLPYLKAGMERAGRMGAVTTNPDIDDALSDGDPSDESSGEE